jgi:flagellum-specific peptidoglycan hydrolase FlgJ
MATLKTKADYDKMTNEELVAYLDKLDQATFNSYVNADVKVRYFIDKYGAYFIKAVKGTKLFLSGVMAQSMMESSYGKSNQAINANNFAGVRYNRNIHPQYWTGANGVKWAKWTTAEEGIDNHIDTLLSDRYKNARINAKSPEEQIRDIVKAGYDIISPTVYVNKIKGNISRVRKLLPFGRIE